MKMSSLAAPHGKECEMYRAFSKITGTVSARDIFH